MNYKLFASKMYLLDLRLNFQSKILDKGFASTLTRVFKLLILLFCISLLSSEAEVLICISHLKLAIEKGVHLCYFLVVRLWRYCGGFR